MSYFKLFEDFTNENFEPKRVEDRAETEAGKRAAEEKKKKEEELSKVTVEEIKFSNFKKAVADEEGIVLLGAGGDLKEWIGGVTDQLKEEGIVEGTLSELWSKIYVMTTVDGRTDLAMVFNPTGKFDMGKMAMWRLRFGDCSWISDYLTNYKSQH